METKFFDPMNRENYIRAVNNGKTINLFLKLLNENRERKIGVVNIAKRELRIRRNPEKHLHYKSNSYGINHALLKYANSFDTIVMKLPDNEYRIPRQWALDNCEFMNFKTQGFEVQQFLNVVSIDKFAKQSLFK